MERDAIDLKTLNVFKLFSKYFIPTLLGMLGMSAVTAIDGIFVGPYDLSVAMGIPTQFDKPEFKAALERILKAVKDAGKFTIIYCADFNVANTRLKQGFDSVTVGQDVNFYIDAINEMVHSIEK